MNMTATATLLFFATTASAALPAPVITVPKSQYVETYFDRRNIGTQSRLVGWQSGDLHRSIKRADITVAGIGPNDRTLCIEVEHVSGGYLGSARVKVNGKASVATLRLPATLFERRSVITAADLSVLVRASTTSRCTSANPILLASWGSQLPSGDTNLLLNQGFGVVTRVSLVGNGRATLCNRLEDVAPHSKATHQQFNTVCRVRLPTSCAPQSKFEIVTDPALAGSPNLLGVLRRTCDR